MVPESGRHSDSKGQIAGDGVRTRQAFGQQRPKSRSRCPNQLRIQTAKSKSQIPVSKSAAHSAATSVFRYLQYPPPNYYS
ncbi:hypothetical protein M3651_08225 [Cytobacillus oceanisediminis]|nr:hypothetical protein [Cytobacillus oceanisediminis]